MEGANLVENNVNNPRKLNFSVYIFHFNRHYEMHKAATQKKYNINTIMLINNKAADLGVYLK